MTDVAIVVPFRDRGRDANRPANLQRALDHWDASPWPVLVVDDGRSGTDSFNRSAAYNRGAARTDADVIVYSESDLIVDYDQIHQAVGQAVSTPGLVVPFSRFMAITPEDSIRVRAHDLAPANAAAEQVRGDRQSIGAVNVVSREALAAIGQYDESFSGAWYDDDAMEIAFRISCGPTRFIDGPGYHLHHLSGAEGNHLTAADRAATAANKARFRHYQRAETAAQIRELTTGQ